MAEERSLQGKFAIVTGAGRGIGRSHALTLARHGATVLVNDIGSGITGNGSDPSIAQSVVEEIRASGGAALADSTDIADWDGARALVDAAISRFGRLDILINNAGITQYGSIETETEQGWSRTLAVNLTGTAALMHWASKHWASKGPASGRAVINTTSPAGTNPPPGATSYCVSKAGVAALTIATATELAHLGVRVNALAPMARSRMTDAVPKLDEIMRTPASGFDRMSPDNVSRLMLYLASPDCRFTGRIFGVDGDDIYIFEGMSADTHLSNAGHPWDHAELSQALAGVDRQDRSYMIAPSRRNRAGSPPLEAFDALARAAAGEPVERLWKPIDG